MIMMWNDVWRLITAMFQDAPPDAAMTRLMMMTMQLSIASIKTTNPGATGAHIFSTVAASMVFRLEQTLT